MTEGPGPKPSGRPGQGGDSPSSWVILMVCEGNLARSPLACALLEQSWPEHRLGPVRVESAGTRAVADRRTAEQMRTIGESLGLDLGQHRARRLTPALLRDSDLVLVMTEQQREDAQRLLPSATSRIFTMIEFVRLLKESTEIGSDLRVIVASAHGRRPYSIGRDAREDVEDPYGHGNRVFRRVATELSALVGALTDLLAAGPRDPDPPHPQEEDRGSASGGFGFWQSLLRPFRRSSTTTGSHGGPARGTVQRRGRRPRRRG